MSRTPNGFAANRRQSGAVHLQLVEQLLDPVLDVPARAGDPLVEGPRRSGSVGHDEAGTSRPGISVIAPRNEVGTPRLPRTPAAARQRTASAPGTRARTRRSSFLSMCEALTARYLRRVLADPERHARGRARPRVPGRTPLRPRELDRSRVPRCGRRRPSSPSRRRSGAAGRPPRSRRRPSPRRRGGGGSRRVASRGPGPRTPPCGRPARSSAAGLPPLCPHRRQAHDERRTASATWSNVIPMPPHVVLGDLDRDLVGRRAHDVGLRDPPESRSARPGPARRCCSVNGSMSPETAMSTTCARFASSRMIGFSVSIDTAAAAQVFLPVAEAAIGRSREHPRGV